MKVMIVMSTSNGEKYLRRQLDSILCQKGVEICCYIRDDGSIDKTREILEEYKKNYACIKCEYGEHVGCAESFFLALKNCDMADYYAFADQDDYWYPNKILNCINLMKKNSVIPELVHCNHRRTDAQLRPLKIEHSKILKKPKSIGNALNQTYVRGCSAVINNPARDLMNRTHPQDMGLFYHDAWCGVICYLFGNVYYIDKPQFDYVKHEKNVSTAGNDWMILLKRTRQVLKKGAYMNFSKILLDNYEEELSDSQKKYLCIVKDYKKSIRNKIYLLFDFGFSRYSFIGTVCLKVHILFNLY